MTELECSVEPVTDSSAQETMFESNRYSRGVVAAEPLPERRARLKEMELRINAILAAATSLNDYQTSLYEIIENVLVEELGYSLGPWEYDCEIEYWGGMSYMDSTIPDEMILRSEYPKGVRLHWGELPCENGEQADG